MDPNTLTNVGTDFGVLISAIVVWAFCIIAVVMVTRLFKKWRVANEEWHRAGEKDDTRQIHDRIARKIFISTLLAGGLLATGLWLMFGAFGSGDPVQLPPPEKDGFWQQTQEAPDEITDEQKDALGEEKLPPILREMKEISRRDAGAEDDYIKKAIERSKGMLP